MPAAQKWLPGDDEDGEIVPLSDEVGGYDPAIHVFNYLCILTLLWEGYRNISLSHPAGTLMPRPITRMLVLRTMSPRTIGLLSRIRRWEATIQRLM